MLAPASPSLGLGNSPGQFHAPTTAVGCAGVCRASPVLELMWRGGGPELCIFYTFMKKNFAALMPLAADPLSNSSTPKWSNGLTLPSFLLSDSHSNPITFFFLLCLLLLISPGEISVPLAQGSGCVSVCLQGQHTAWLLQTQAGKLWTRKECSRAAGWLEHLQLELISHKPPQTAQPGDRLLACSLGSLVMLSALCKKWLNYRSSETVVSFTSCLLDSLCSLLYLCIHLFFPTIAGLHVVLCLYCSTRSRASGSDKCQSLLVRLWVVPAKEKSNDVSQHSSFTLAGLPSLEWWWSLQWQVQCSATDTWHFGLIFPK